MEKVYILHSKQQAIVDVEHQLIIMRNHKQLSQHHKHYHKNNKQQTENNIKSIDFLYAPWPMLVTMAGMKCRPSTKDGCR
jgi:hypothetical protein